MPRLCFTLLLVLLVLFGAVVVALRYVVLPGIEQYRGDILQSVSDASGMAVTARELRGGWDGLRPFIELSAVRFADPKAGTTGLALDEMHASLSWWSLLRGKVMLHEVVLQRPELHLRRDAAGLIHFNGKPLNQKTGDQQGGALPWLLQQPRLAVQNAVLVWEDDMTAAAGMRLDEVEVRVQKSGSLHRIGVRARPPAALAGRLELQAQLDIEGPETRPDASWQVKGTLFAAADHASLAEAGRHMPIPAVMRTATGNVRAWIELDTREPRGLKSITADVNAVDVTAQWSAETAPVALATLAGRIDYRAEGDGFAVSSKALQLRTRDGVRMAPMDFSVRLAEPKGAAPRGEITGDGIDLQVMSALLNYFPIGRDVRLRVAEFAPRGTLNGASLAWTGKPDTLASYRLKARVTNVALNAVDALPGLQGISGTIEGDEKGGRFEVDAGRSQLDLPRIFRAPLPFDKLHLAGTWERKDNGGLQLAIDRSRIENADLTGQVKGTWRRGGEGPGVVELRGDFERVDAGRLGAYFPNRMPGTRAWVDRAIPTGKLSQVAILVSGDMWHFPFIGDQHGKFHINARAEDTRLRFRDDWPAIDGISADFSLQGSRITVKADKAAIFQSRVGATQVEIDNFMAWVPMLSVKGTAHATAQDVARYLRESPLREGPGLVTNVLGVEGPGKLDLALQIALAPRYEDGRPAPYPKVSGAYAFNGVTARPTVGGVVADVQGVLQFTERSVASRDLRGSAYGHPLTIVVSGGGEAGIVTELSGRADIGSVNDFLPFRLPAQVTGTADWKGRIVTRNGVDMLFTSDLSGITSRLPAPLAKAPADVQNLAVSFSATGTPNELISLRVGNLLYGKFARRVGADGTSRLASGLISLEQPIGDAALADGLWLSGKTAQLDIDQWRAALYPPVVGPAAAAPGVAAGEPGEQGGLVGFDLEVERLTAYGRDLRASNVKGRRAGEDWRLTIASNELSGDATWRPSAAGGSGFVRARLTNFILNPHSDRAGVAVEPAVETDFPALDITADRFEFHGRKLGKLDLKSEPEGRDWRIDRLFIDGDGATLDASGRWIRTRGPSRSEFRAKVDARNLNGLLRIFGYGDAIRRGTGQLEGTLAWPGSPTDFAFRKLSGEFKLEARRGEFAKIEPGAARLLGLVSLQSIPRRITLDFRDVFSEGFGFDRISGSFKIDAGVMRTEDFEIAGPSAYVTMQGEVSLPDESQNLKLTVVPSLGDSVSIITTLIGGPVVGLTTLLAQKLLQDPVGRAFGYEYKVTGKWDNPDVARIGGGQPKAAAAGEATTGNKAAPAAAGSAPPKNEKKKS